MSDRLTLAHAIEDASIERAKAERVVSAIADLIHDAVATMADVTAVRADLKADITAVRTEIAAVRTGLQADIASVQANLVLVEHRLFTRLCGLAVEVAGALFAALRYWPPVAH